MIGEKFPYWWSLDADGEGGDVVNSDDADAVVGGAQYAATRPPSSESIESFNHPTALYIMSNNVKNEDGWWVTTRATQGQMKYIILDEKQRATYKTTRWLGKCLPLLYVGKVQRGQELSSEPLVERFLIADELVISGVPATVIINSKNFFINGV